MNIDRQKFFDTAVAGLASQGFQRAVTYGYAGFGIPACRYRNKEGRRCAIGWNIPDEQYDDSFENKKGYIVLELLGYDISGTPGNDFDFIDYLQKSHDEAESPEDMKNNLRLFAAKYHLQLPKELMT